MPEESPSATIAEAFARTVDALATPGISYAVIGGLAVSYHGIPRPTRDVDVMLMAPRIRLPGLLERFAEIGFTFEMMDVLRQLSEDHLATLQYRGVPLDLLDAVLPFFRRVVENAEEATIEGRIVRLASAEDLIALKLIAAREDDLRDVRGILAVSRSRLHLESVRQALEECATDDRLSLLERLVQETGP